jgi:hypothetical protein
VTSRCALLVRQPPKSGLMPQLTARDLDDLEYGQVNVSQKEPLSEHRQVTVLREPSQVTVFQEARQWDHCPLTVFRKDH